MQIHYFQRYHSKENVDTSNTMLMLSRLYNYNADKFFSMLNSLILGEDESPEITFDLQVVGDDSVPDAVISQKSFKIVVETKLYNQFYKQQLVNHLEQFGAEDIKVLLTLDPKPMKPQLFDELAVELKKYNSENATRLIHPIKHVNLTFEQLVDAMEDIVDDRDTEIIAVLDDFKKYCAHCGRKLQRTFGTDVHFYCVTPYWDTDEEPCKSVRWDRTDIEEVVLAALKAQIAVMTVETVGKIQNTTSEGTLLRQRLKVLASELESGDTQKVQSYLDYREGRITKDEFITLRSEREKRMEELKNLIAETEVAYEDFLEKENQAKQEQAIVERTSSMNDEALKELMYDAVERINVTDNQNIEIIWKFDDLFATA